MSTKYEDNFGLYRIDDDNPEELEFFCHIRAQSEPTICATLQSESSIARAHQNMCAACSHALEFGAQGAEEARLGLGGKKLSEPPTLNTRGALLFRRCKMLGVGRLNAWPRG
jgi:hypothetical protein